MKKLLSLFLVIALAYNINAQITINSIDLIVGDSLFQATDSTSQTNLFSSGGADLTWDFSEVLQQKIDTIAPIDPATTDHADDFTNSNLAFGTVEFAGYTQNNTNEYVSLGFGGYIASIDADILMVFSDADTINDFPMNYGDSRDAAAYGTTTANVQGQDIRLSRSTFRTQEIDAWGEITTPEGTYDVLRVNEYLIEIDSVFAIMYGSEAYQEDYSSFDTSYNYIFYTTSINHDFNKYPLLEVQYDNNTDTSLSIKWLTYEKQSNGIVKISDSKNILVYPNPTSDIVNIKTTENIISVNIYNTEGKVVKTTSKHQIQISDLPSSIYFIEVKTKNNLYRKKIIIK